MKYLVIIATSFFSLGLNAQTNSNERGNYLLIQVLQTLNNLQRVSYHTSQERKYHADNYYNLSNTDLYFEFGVNTSTGLRYQSRSEGKKFIYNGQSFYRFDNKEMTVDTTRKNTLVSMENNSDLFHSFGMLRNILPLVIESDSIQKIVSDTMINGVSYTSIKMEAPFTYLGMFHGIEHFTVKDLQRPYYLVIDKKTMLPYLFITKFIRGEDARDFITVTYTDINTNPSKPAENSWYYETYANVYKYLPPVVRKPMIKPGATVAGFTLPLYTPSSIDSLSLQQYAGKVVLLDFWFKSCGPCMEAMPKYNLLQSKYEKQGFVLLTVNIEDPVEDIKFFYNKHKPNYPMLFKGGKVFSDFGLIGCPSSIMIGKDGIVAAVYESFDEKGIEKKLEQILNR